MEYEDYPLKKKEGFSLKKKHHAEVVCATSKATFDSQRVGDFSMPSNVMSCSTCSFEAQISNLESSKGMKFLNTLGGFISIQCSYICNILLLIYFIIYIIYVYIQLYIYVQLLIYIYIIYIDLKWPKSLHTTSRCIPSWWGTCRAANGMQPDPWWLLCCHVRPMLTQAPYSNRIRNVSLWTDVLCLPVREKSFKEIINLYPLVD